MRGLLLLCLCLTSPTAAQSVHKCADGRGGHVYQSQACPQGESLRTWEAVADPVSTSTPTVANLRPPARPRQASPSLRAREAASAAPARRDDQHGRCLAARASRDSALQKLGHRRNYDDLRRLNERVSAVCNHRGRP